MDEKPGEGREGEMMGDTPDFTDEDLEVADYLLDHPPTEAEARHQDGRASSDSDGQVVKSPDGPTL